MNTENLDTRKGKVCMKKQQERIVEETFFLGRIHVTLIDPNSYFPSESTQENISVFLTKSREIFEINFNDLGRASRDFYKYEHSLDIQRETITKYLDMTSNKVVMEEVGLSNKAVSELKHKKSDLKSMTLDTFEKLYRCAAKKVNKIQ